MSYCCEHDNRRDAVRSKYGLNGLDYLDVSDDQRSLQVYFLGKLPPELAHKISGDVPWLRIDGGRRVTGIRITGIAPTVDPDPEKDDMLTVYLDKYGDFSTYTLSLVGVENIDPHYDHLDFSFKVNCPSELDCQPACECEPEVAAEPDINYLARDYQSFRQLILDRLAILMPDWQESHAADLGITLVELLAYVGDYLSYYQDAVATEAYLDTARQRISVRRHVRLVDYYMHEGCNARTWVSVESDVDLTLPPGAVFTTRIQDPRAEGKTIIDSELLAALPSPDFEFFEAVEQGEVAIHAANSEIKLYTWGEKICCLEKGSTSATLLDRWEEKPEQPPAELARSEKSHEAQKESCRLLKLKAGDVIILEEVMGPRTGLAEDADPAKRHAVRLTKVEQGVDDLIRDCHGRPTPYLHVEWDGADALPFTFCLSAIGAAPCCAYLQDISVARGNVLLVDHGRTLPSCELGSVPSVSTTADCDCVGAPGEIHVHAGLFRPKLPKGNLTYRQPLPVDNPDQQSWTPAARLMAQDVRQALPQTQLSSTFGRRQSQHWQAVYDLLCSGPEDLHFVIEVDDAGIGHLRFGDGELGTAPLAGSAFTATYRVGNGKAGNVGAEAISHLVLDGPSLGASEFKVRNPIPASGGTAAESMAEAKLHAPHLFRKTLERAITADDYRVIAERNDAIERASAALHWTGSWYQACVAVDPRHSDAADAALIDSMELALEKYRRIGHDLAVVKADYVPLDITLHVCVLPHFERADVKTALLAAFSNRKLANGKLGFFHPDNLTFGAAITLSSLVAAAQAVPGVQCATVEGLQRQFEAANHELENGILPLRSREIAQLDNDPSFPEHGQLKLVVEGGR